ncbi:ABC transporter ATP-binding protein [bacterium]|nr:ABC transporter ATP-binding protein [candidate division CSSED10-310 bacterium]
MISIRRLCKRFDAKIVLDELDLDVYRGESLVVIGGSGTGKSVLIKNIIGLLKPDSGVIKVDGVNVAELETRGWRKFRRKFGMLFQGAALFDSMTVAENVAFPLVEHTSKSRAEIAVLAEEKLSMVGLAGISGKRPSDLSGGMRKRVGLARALAMEPAIMLYDEPTTGLDPITGDAIDRLIVKLRDQLHMTSITITHDMASAFRIASRIAMLYKGKIIQVDSPERIKTTDNSIVREFVKDRSRLATERGRRPGTPP